jgi:hypothetical protein
VGPIRAGKRLAAYIKIGPFGNAPLFFIVFSCLSAAFSLSFVPYTTLPSTMVPYTLSALLASAIMTTRVVAQSEVLASTPLVDKHYTLPAGAVSHLFFTQYFPCSNDFSSLIKQTLKPMAGDLNQVTTNATRRLRTNSPSVRLFTLIISMVYFIFHHLFAVYSRYTIVQISVFGVPPLPTPLLVMLKARSSAGVPSQATAHA